MIRVNNNKHLSIIFIYNEIKKNSILKSTHRLYTVNQRV